MTVMVLDDIQTVCQLVLLLIGTSLIVHLYLVRGMVKVCRDSLNLPVRLGGQAGHPCSRPHCCPYCCGWQDRGQWVQLADRCNFTWSSLSLVSLERGHTKNSLEIWLLSYWQI